MLAALPADTFAALATKVRILVREVGQASSPDYCGQCVDTLLDDIERLDGTPPDATPELAAFTFDAIFQADAIDAHGLSRQYWLELLTKIRCATMVCSKTDTELEAMVRGEPEAHREFIGLIPSGKQSLLDSVKVLNATAMRLAVIFARLDGQDGAP